MALQYLYFGDYRTGQQKLIFCPVSEVVQNNNKKAYKRFERTPIGQDRESYYTEASPSQFPDFYVYTDTTHPEYEWSSAFRLVH